MLKVEMAQVRSQRHSSIFSVRYVNEVLGNVFLHCKCLHLNIQNFFAVSLIKITN